MTSDLKKKIIIIIALMGGLLILIFQQGLYSKEQPIYQEPTKSLTINNSVTPSDEPQLLSTNPAPLEEAIVFPTQVIELNFNSPLVNEPELKLKIEPKVDYKIELTNKKMTAKIIPTTPYQMGGSFTLFVLPETKFDNGKTLSKDYIYHFKTIQYRGV